MKVMKSGGVSIYLRPRQKSSKLPREHLLAYTPKSRS
jgi:hypothetical protein